MHSGCVGRGFLGGKCDFSIPPFLFWMEDGRRYEVSRAFEQAKAGI